MRNARYIGYTGRGRVRRGANIPLLSIWFFPAAILYQELLLRAFDRDTPFFSLALLRTALFSLAAGLLLALLLDLLPWKSAGRVIGGVLLGLGAVLLCVERGCRATFGIYYGVTFMGDMAGAVAGNFGSTVAAVIAGLIPFILLSLVPVALCVLLRAGIVPDEGQDMPVRIIMASVLVACQLSGYLMSTLGGVKNYYTYDFTASTSIPNFGLLTSVRLELEYAVAGVPTAPLDAFLDDPASPPSPNAQSSAAPSDAPAPSGTPSQPPAGASGPNVLDIDFEALAEAEANEVIQSMHQYFGSLTPSEKNQYTGMFQGKNLILLTGEAFSTCAVDQDLTPTLYKLTHEGFVFHNFYQPDWTQSTCGGEFSVTTGLIPNWISPGSKLAANASADNAMPVTLAKLFAARGYSVPAWHDNTYTYYGRDEYLSNFGYDYKGLGGGLEMARSVENNWWPQSDLEMMEETADSYIDAYVSGGKPFHAYYMTVSGHGYYTWAGNDMAALHREEVQARYPGLSEPAQAYLACNIELDRALKYLVDKLEAAGIADDTLIVMTGDHYPYMLVDDDGADYYNELRGFEDSEGETSRYRNTLIMWSGAIETPIEVDTPCSSIDIVPTLCNLFGLEYDSRLYSGRDIFAANYEPDQYSNCMPLVVFANNKGQGNAWITAAGVYEASTREFTPNEGIHVDENYVSRVNRLVAAKINYAKLIVQEDYYRYVFPGAAQS